MAEEMGIELTAETENLYRELVKNGNAAASNGEATQLTRSGAFTSTHKYCR
jgi:hypothetical protein